MSIRRGPLTERQHFIIQKVIEGLEHKEIAALLKLNSRAAVSNEVRMIVAKLGVRNSAQAIALYSRWQACGLSEEDTAALDQLVPGAPQSQPANPPAPQSQPANPPAPQSQPANPPAPQFSNLFAEPPATGYSEDEEGPA